MNKHEAIFQRMKEAPVFLKNELEGAIVKGSMPGPVFLVKFQGKEPFVAKPESEVVTDAILEGVFSSEAEFENF